ncbi:MAG: hypothetical protein J7527_17955, partial [Chitinophagaceae bacterium]|nr:hypothetical protein [Chitinophagaceae bacterium]
LSVLSIATCQLSFAQNHFPSSGYVGINTTNPDAPLHVSAHSHYNSYGWFGRHSGGALTSVLRLGQNAGWDKETIDISVQDVNGYAYSYWTALRDGHTFVFKRQSPIGEKWMGGLGGTDANHHFTLYSAVNGAAAKIQFNTESASYIENPLGIGTAYPNPGAKLNIHTTEQNHGMQLTHNSGGIIRFHSNSYSNGAYNDIVRQNDAGIIFGQHTGGNDVNFGFVLAPWRGGGASGLRVDNMGNVAIATNVTDPNSRLLVNGTIRAKKVKVDAGPWPDYVFNDDYKLLPLPEVAAFIQKNKHLPGVPSAKEVQQTGVDVGETQEVLLKKIEELTLYIIDQQKQIEELKKRNEVINTLSSEIQALKQLIRK